MPKKRLTSTLSTSKFAGKSCPGVLKGIGTTGLHGNHCPSLEIWIGWILFPAKKAAMDSSTEDGFLPSKSVEQTLNHCHSALMKFAAKQFQSNIFIYAYSIQESINLA